MSKKTKDIHVGIVAGMADLYNRVLPELPSQLNLLLEQLPENLKTDNLEFLTGNIACTKEQFEIEVKKLLDKDVDVMRMLTLFLGRLFFAKAAFIESIR